MPSLRGGGTTNEATHNTFIIKANEDYQYLLGSLGDEDGLVLSRQATHYEISEITFDTASLYLNFIYKYKPMLNYVGSDQVEIKRSTGSDGSSPNNIITLTTIEFTITN